MDGQRPDGRNTNGEDYLNITVFLLLHLHIIKRINTSMFTKYNFFILPLKIILVEKLCIYFLNTIFQLESHNRNNSK